LTAISVIIPAYNEASRLPRYLDSILAYFHGSGVPFEVVVVDDGSSDDTAAVVEGYQRENAEVALVRLPQNRGKGFAVKTGMLAATGKLRLFADADGSTPIAELERLSEAIEAGADVAVGSRALHNDACRVHCTLHRKIIGSTFNYIVRTLTVQGIRDTQCGFKLFTSEAAERIFPSQQIDGFGFDVEILFIARKREFRIAEVPVNWSDVKGTKVRLVRDSMRMFADVVRIRLNHLRGSYALALLPSNCGENQERFTEG
jgi:dolichyl-phosphate beta-glucosyltransferase